MTRLPRPPQEIPAITSLAALAPGFRVVVERILARMQELGFSAKVSETLRTDARQAYLYGFGRAYDDGRGIVTKSTSALTSWHGYGLAVDIVHATLEWGAPATFWTALARVALAEGMTSGADWNRNGIADESFCDRPHLQWYTPGMHVSPSAHAITVFQTQGMAAVWQELGAQ